MISTEYLAEIFDSYGITSTKDQLQQFDQYAQLLVEWNQKINLTSILEPKEICVKHFLDSVLLLNAIEVGQGASLIDVGTGAGFPTVPCKIVRSDLKVTLLDSLNKRVNFLSILSEDLHQQNQCVHGRAEEFGKKAEYRECFDFATARAVAHLRELAEYCLPFVKVGGYFVALKSADIKEELEESKKAIKLFGGSILEIKHFNLPEYNKRSIILIKKISQTPTKYPRNAAKIKKQAIQ